MTDYLTELFHLDGKVGALTGAGGFLVSEISRGMVRARVKVALLDKKKDAVQEEIQGIMNEGG